MTQPKKLTMPWAENGLKNVIPLHREGAGVTSASATYEDGFPETTMKPIYEGGKAPSGKDMNGILHEITAHIVHGNKGNFYQFDEEFCTLIGGYSKGAVLISDDKTKLFISLINNNKSNFNIKRDDSKWYPLLEIELLSKPSGFKYIGQVESFAELRKIEPTEQGQRILVKSINAGANLGGGEFYADMNDTTTEDDNRHTVITAGRHRWKRLVQYDSHIVTLEVTDISSDKTYSKFLAFSAPELLEKLGLAAGDYSGIQYASVGKQVAQLLTRGYGLHYLRVNDLLSGSDDVWTLEKILTDVDLSHQIAGTSQTKAASEYAVGKLNETVTAALNSLDLSDVTLSEKSKNQLKSEIAAQVANEAYARTQGFVKAEAQGIQDDLVKMKDVLVKARMDNKGKHPALALSIEDERSQIALGITEQGDWYQHSAETRNTTYPGWGVTDSQDRLLLGFNTATAEFETADKKEGFTTAHVFAQTDNDYKLAEQTLNSGEKYIPAGIISDAGICFIQDGDVYLQQGTVTTQITQRGDVVACEMSGSAVRYVAPRRGLFLTYEWRNGEVSQVFEQSDIDGFFLTGQSLAVSADNVATSTTAFSDKAFTISTGPMWHKEWNNQITGIIPLRERYYETVMSNFGKSVLAKKDKPIMVFGSARGGRSYRQLIKGGESGAYEKVIKAMSFVQNTPYKVNYKAMLVIHGEQDGKEKNSQYDQNLNDWLDSYTQDLQAINGQADKPVMLMCQTAGAAYYRPNLADRHQFTTPFLQLKASAENPRIFAVTPKYMFPCVDGIHIDGKSADILGDYYGKVKHIVVDKGEDWLGLRPIRCQKVSSRTVEITFNVPNPPLVFDTQIVSDPGNYGFYLYKGNGVSISNVALDEDNNKVIITTNESIPDGASITYAFDNGSGKSGPTEGARGCLRDSCSDLSSNGSWTLHNWCFAFEEKITY